MLMSELPVAEIMYHLVLEDDYWFIREAHRHQGGRFGDCPRISYARLTVAEGLDVLVSTYAALLGCPEEEYSEQYQEEPF